MTTTKKPILKIAPVNERPLGCTQADALKALRRYGQWHKGCNWTYGNDGETARVLDTLVRRGLATRKVEKGRAVYRPVTC